MARRKPLRFNLLSFKGSKPEDGSWDVQDRHYQGKITRYHVVDKNLPRLRDWEFDIMIPNDPDGYAKLQCVRPAGYLDLSKLSGKHITFGACNTGRYGKWGWRYHLLGPVFKGERSHKRVPAQLRTLLPYWFHELILAPKDRVREDSGTTGEYLVALVKPEDHQSMIAIWIAEKPWVRLRPEATSGLMAKLDIR